MKAIRILSILVTIIVSVACASNGVNVKEGDEYPKFVDTSVESIIIKNPNSVKSALGNINILNEGQGMPFVNVCNKLCTEVLTLYFHYGDTRNSVSEFRVSKSNIKEAITLVTVDHFVSGKGIKLGLSREEVINILGREYTREVRDGKLIIYYLLKGMESSAFLSRYNMPFYYGEYVFINDILVEYRFGFEYP